MTAYTHLVLQRFRTQGLVNSTFTRPADVVGWLGAVQSQDYAGAMWALGLRIPALTAAEADRAFDAGEILRTHVLRPTWHFLTPADARWILTLSAPRVHQCSGSVYRMIELDARLAARSRRVFERALRDSRHLTRAELAVELGRAGIKAAGLRLAYIVMHAELERVIISGPRRGKQFTYALFDERAPRAKTMKPDEAIHTLACRYFTGHGPATVRDFAWWSGLTMAQARRGVEMSSAELEKVAIAELTCWAARARSGRQAEKPVALLLPNYDECLIAYKERGGMIAGRDVFQHHLLVDGRLAGSWTRNIGRERAAIKIVAYSKLTRSERKALDVVVDRYARFVGMRTNLSIESVPSRSNLSRKKVTGPTS